MSSWLRGIFIASLVLAGLSLFILAATSTDSTLFERWFPVLLVINRAIAVVLFAVVAAMALRLWQRLRNKEFGARRADHDCRPKARSYPAGLRC